MFCLEYFVSSYRIARALCESSQDKTQRNQLIKASAYLMAIVCVTQLVYQLCLQNLLLLPFKLDHILLPRGEDSQAVYTMTHRLSFLTSVFSSASLVGSWFLGSLYLFVWAMIFSSKTDFGWLLALNAYAFMPVTIFSVLGVIVLLCAGKTATDLVWGDPPLSRLVMNSEEYKAYVPTIPLIIALKTISYTAEAYSLIMLAINTSISQKISLSLALAGTALYGVFFYAVVIVLF